MTSETIRPIRSRAAATRVLTVVLLAQSGAFAQEATAEAGAASEVGASAEPSSEGEFEAAQPLETDGEHLEPSRDRGFYLRLNAGAGYIWADTDGELSLNGPTVNAMLNVGGYVFDNLAIHGDAWGNIATSYDESSVLGVASESGGTLGWMAFGAGGTYYFRPVDIFVGLGAGFAWNYATTYAEVTPVDRVTLEARAKEGSDIGYGAYLTIGKEWGVSDCLGLGVSGFYSYMNVAATDDALIQVTQGHMAQFMVSASWGP